MSTNSLPLARACLPLPPLPLPSSLPSPSLFLSLRVWYFVYLSVEVEGKEAHTYSRHTGKKKKTICKVDRGLGTEDSSLSLTARY